MNFIPSSITQPLIYLLLMCHFIFFFFLSCVLFMCFVFLHISVDDMPDCSTDAEELRVGLVGGYGIEDMLVAAGVDVYFTAHEHSYERTFPVYRGLWQQYGDDSANGTYVDPSYPAHIITGSGGCREGKDTVIKYMKGRQSYYSAVVVRYHVNQSISY